MPRNFVKRNTPEINSSDTYLPYDKMALLHWVLENMDDWNLICGTGPQPPTSADIRRLFSLLLKLARNSLVFTVFLTGYYEEILPPR